MKKVTDNVDAD